MCIFSGEARVSNTEIFVRIGDDGVQTIVYKNEFETAAENAMIIPIPEKTVREDAVEFINMENHDEFFRDLDRLFPQRKRLSRGVDSFDMLKSHLGLEVHQVGSFEASYVPSQDDFDRLDERFKLDAAVWEMLPQYVDYGFVVFKFKAGKNKPHPMAFRFKTDDPRFAYYPTVHVHDGQVHASERFDHTLYLQAAPFRDANEGPWTMGVEDRHDILDKYDELGLVDQEKPSPIWKMGMHRHLPNKDVLVQL